MRIHAIQSRSRSSRPHSVLHVCLAACGALVVSQCSVVRSPETHTREDPAPPGAESVASVLTNLLRRAAALDAAASAAWPGFDLRSHVLIVAHEPEGPAALVGDSAPPPPWRAVDARRDVFLLDGPPPDSLAGLRVARTWNGRRYAATALSYRGPHTLATLIHEAFHTHQRRVQVARPQSFHSGATPNYPDTAIEAVAFVILEARLLAGALAAPTTDHQRERALAALAVRAHRCRVVGSQECASERDIERNEGTATYVAAAIVGTEPGNPVRDSLASLSARLAGFADLTRLGRWHFYDTGVAWLTLLERLGLATWKTEVEIAPPDSVLASHLGLTSQRADSLWDQTNAAPMWEEARRTAERLVTTELALRDSVHRAFWAQVGTLVTVYWKMARSISSEWQPLPGQVVRGFIVRDSVRGELEYSTGIAESTIRIDDRRNWIKLKGHSASVHGSSQAFVAITPVAGRTARVGNRVVPLDFPAPAVHGQVAFQLDHIELMLENASLEVFTDSVIVRMQ